MTPEEVERLGGFADALASEARKGCHCEKDRKPCSYHLGVADGADMLVGMVREAWVRWATDKVIEMRRSEGK